MERSARDRYITIYGRIPVLEVLADPSIDVDKVVVARGGKGPQVNEIVAAAKARGVHVEWASPDRVTRISRNGRHDQGVVADITAPGLAELPEWLGTQPAGAPAALLVLDGVTNPGNVGMIIRAATAAGLTGVVLPRYGCADIGPLVLKASAGVAFRATILRTDTTKEALVALAGAGFRICGLSGTAPRSVYDGELPGRGAYVLGNESEGIGPGTAELITEWLSLPLANGVESLNVATAAAVLAYEIARRRLT